MCVCGGGGGGGNNFASFYRYVLISDQFMQIICALLSACLQP